LGVDHTKLTFRIQGGYFRLTGVAGNVVTKVLAYIVFTSGAYSDRTQRGFSWKNRGPRQASLLGWK
jgi:hypothetical protein